MSKKETTQQKTAYKKPQKPAHTFSRREALGSAVIASLTLGSASCTQSRPEAQTSTPRPRNAPPMPETLLVNRERAHQIMLAEGLDALICSRPENIYYLTNYDPQLAKMGMENIVFAVLPLDMNARPILVVGEYEYYIAGTEGSTSKHADVRFFTMPAEPEIFKTAGSLSEQLDAPGFPSFLPQQHKFHSLSNLEAYKRTEIYNLKTQMGATSQTSLLKALRDMPKRFKRFGIDNAALPDLIRRAEIDATFANGDQTLRRIRLQKSPAEITLMRYAARANAEAGLAATKIVRDGGSFQDLRREYYRQCVDRFMTPSFMAIDGIIPESAKGKITEGRSFLIDCVSHGQRYHGDYGRTVCIGEPTAEIARATAAIATVWDDLLPQLKPGMRYSEISALGEKIFKKTNSEAALICGPHSVGLHHTDEPSVEGAGYFMKDDLVLQENMIISVDLPVMDVGLGGSAHLEDLVLIGKDGAEILNDAGDRVIII